MKFNMSGNASDWKGLGDVVEAAAEATFIKKATEMISKKTGKDCGCNKRKEWLNEKFPFKKEGDDAN